MILLIAPATVIGAPAVLAQTTGTAERVFKACQETNPVQP
jgi:hypothetical protein